MKIRACADDDLAAIYAIQSKCPQLAQWRQEDYYHLLYDPLGTILVAEVGDANLPRVTGFAAFRRVMEEAELRNLAIDHLYRRKGLGHALLSAGVRAMQQSGVCRIFLEVRASNQPALAFYRAAGFKLLHTRRDYYHDPVEDALVMACDIGAISERRFGKEEL